MSSDIAGKDVPVERSVLFAGAVPEEDVETVFRLLAGEVGSRALALPDGEVGDRRGWIYALKRTVWERCEDIEAIPSAFPEGTPYRERFSPSFRIREGAAEVRLGGLLPHARDAVQSYEIFRRLREEGVIDPGVRFLVTFPGAYDAISVWFPDASNWSALIDAWTSAVQVECRRMLEVIPPEDLAVHIDYAAETGLLTGALGDVYPWVPRDLIENGFARVTSAEYLAPHFEGLPETVLAGYHICLGAFPKFPRIPISDLGAIVDAANRLAVNSGRRIDYFHLPVVPNADEHYFAPLARLDVGAAAVYLGLECADGVEAMDRRMTHARKFLKRFGVAHYCGYSRNPEPLQDLLSDLRVGADHQATALSAT
jgi:hypothetical protein